MENNYANQAKQAKKLFLDYDQEKLIEKLRLDFDETYLYVRFLGAPYRIHRKTGDAQRQVGDTWVDGNSHGEIMTLMDLVCDSKEDRHLSGRWKNMADFGLLFHRNHLEQEKDPWAEKFQNDQAGFRRACAALGGKPVKLGDIGYAIEVFDGLPIALQLWLGDDEFPPNLRFLWDENALQYIRYETMFYCLGVLLERIGEEMAKNL